MRWHAAGHVWLLEFSVKGPEEPVYPMMGAVVFSTEERALEWIAGHGVRVRWDPPAPNPDYRSGFSRGDRVWWKWVLCRTQIDGEAGEGA